MPAFDIVYFLNHRLFDFTYEMKLDDEDGKTNGLEVYDAAEIGTERYT